jgi:hypothetical protein
MVVDPGGLEYSIHWRGVARYQRCLDKTLQHLQAENVLRQNSRCWSKQKTVWLASVEKRKRGRGRREVGGGGESEGWFGLVIALRPQTPKHIRGGWSHYIYTSEPVDGGVGTLQLWTTRTILSVKMDRENSLTLFWPEWGSNPIPSDPQSDSIDCATGSGHIMSASYLRMQLKLCPLQS